MAELIINISDDLKGKMSEFSIDWSSIAGEAIKNKLTQMILFKSIVSESKLTQEDALEIGRKINASLHKRYEEERN